MNRPTIADLANAAGVSLSTVNRLLHDDSGFREVWHVFLSSFQEQGAHRERGRKRATSPRLDRLQAARDQLGLVVALRLR